jgi:xanthine dehydrogenase YagS FAD-binding subunit
MRYARAGSVEQAIELLAEPGARVLAGGTDLAGQIDRGITAPGLLVDVSRAGLGALRPSGAGVAIGAAVTLSEIASSEALAPYRSLQQAAAAAASPLLRNVGTVGGNLCQLTRCWYLRSPEWHCWLGGGDTCYAQIGDHRKHNLQAGDCISAHPSDLAPPLASLGARVTVASASGTREIALLELYRRPTDENRALVALAPGELVTEVRLPAPPAASGYHRLGERQAFSFPLVGVAAARANGTGSGAAAGVANVPVAIDPSDPLRDLPGNPQSLWKQQVLERLVERALAEVG